MTDNAPEFLNRPGLPSIAVRRVEGSGPAIVWLGGFKSDMIGTKAAALAAWAQETGRAFVRFDYSGHGESQGAFEDGTIGAWRDDALAVLDQLTEGPLVLVGSSMGGWITLLAALKRPERVKAIALIAPAPDFTERLIWQDLDFEQRRAVMEKGRWEQPSEYGDGPYVIARPLIEDGRKHLLLDGPIGIECPVRILHGQQDPDVPWRQSLLLAEQLVSSDVAVTFIKDGDHRLSREQDIARLIETIEELAR